MVTFGISPQLNGYTPERSLALFERLEEELAAVPGVTGVTACARARCSPAATGAATSSVEGFETGPDTDANARFNEVGPGYFRTLGMPLLAGREFTPPTPLARRRSRSSTRRSRRSSTSAATPSASAWAPGGEATELDIEIVGLVQNAKYSEVKDPIPPLFFRPYRQDDDLAAS